MNSTQAVESLFGDVTELSTVVATVEVSEKGLGAVFNTLKPIFRKVEISRCLKFQIYKGRLFISASVPSVAYEARFPAPDCNDFEVVCRYCDLSNLFSATGTCTLTLSSQGVFLRTKYMQTNLMASVESFTPQDFDTVEFEPLGVEEVAYAFTGALSLNAYAKAYKLNASFICRENFMQVRYPTLYVQYPFNGFETVMDYNAAQMLSGFLHGTIEVGHLGNLLVFKRGDEFLATNLTPVSACEELSEFMAGANFLGHIEARGSLALLKELQASFGKSPCWAEFSDKAARYTIETPQATISASTGELGPILAKFQIDTALLHNILSTVGFSFDMYAKDNMFMVKNKAVAVFTCKS